MKNPAIRTLIFWIGGALLVAAAYRAYEWRGVALIVTGIFFWLMLHFTRLVQALKRAADRPVGYIGSAVMLNAKLKPGVNLLHVVALTRSLGALGEANLAVTARHIAARAKAPLVPGTPDPVKDADEVVAFATHRVRGAFARGGFHGRHRAHAARDISTASLTRS